MTDPHEKFLRKQNAKLRGKLRAAIVSILADDLDGLDIKPLQGQPHYFRCRVGDIRIIFVDTGEGNVLAGIGYRGDIY